MHSTSSKVQLTSTRNALTKFQQVVKRREMTPVAQNDSRARDEPEHRVAESKTAVAAIDAAQMEKLATSDELSSSPAPPSLPDGGIRAWLQVAGSFIVFANLWGMCFAFGSFQSYYEIDYLPSTPPSAISWIGTINTFLLVFIGIVSGPLFDAGHFRLMLLCGAGVQTLGVFTISLCSPVYYQLFLTQGILAGLGGGLLYIPGLALVGRAFQKHRALALGLTTCGAPTGGIFYTLIFEQLIERPSFGATVRVMGYTMLASYLISFPLLLFRAPNLGTLTAPAADGTPPPRRKLLDLTAFRDLPFCWFTLANFFIFSGYMVPFIYMASFGQNALGLSRSFSLYVIMIAQAASIFGRLIPGAAAARYGSMLPWIVCSLSSGIFCIAWVGVDSRGSLIAFAVLYGAFSGALIPLPPAAFPLVCPDPKILGTRLGMSQGICALASLTGSPIAGALTRGADYLGLQLFSGLVMSFGAANLIGLWVLLVRRRGLGKLI